ncbi:unnamed protein product [Euphydryas editha]|uniref:Uncharacterized protein n=1 Tax=Euphydryas editha TaxID=104508 RepID=A0AAU9TJ70_EUPED|nr:unnamed protein product [Euphydryas editha]
MFAPIFSRVVNRVHDDVCSELNFALLKAPLQYSVNEQNLTPDTKCADKALTDQTKQVDAINPQFGSLLNKFTNRNEVSTAVDVNRPPVLLLASLLNSDVPFSCPAIRS